VTVEVNIAGGGGGGPPVGGGASPRFSYTGMCLWHRSQILLILGILRKNS